MASPLETVWAYELGPSDQHAFDAFVLAARSGSYVQTRTWASVVSAVRPRIPRYFLARRGGAIVGSAVVLQHALLRLFGLPFATIERGPVCDSLDDLGAVLEALLRCTRRSGILHLSVMPGWTDEARGPVERILNANGFAVARGTSDSYVRTLMLDLAALPPDPFQSSMLAKARREVRRAERAGAIVRSGGPTDVAWFRERHEEQMRRLGRHLPPAVWYRALADYFLSDERRGAMFVSEFGGAIIAAIFVARHGSTATYVLGKSTTVNLSFPKMVQPLAAAIAWAKAERLSTFDLGGIGEEGNTDPKFKSVMEFKRTFSRTELLFAREHVRWF